MLMSPNRAVGWGIVLTLLLNIIGVALGLRWLYAAGPSSNNSSSNGYAASRATYTKVNKWLPLLLAHEVITMMVIVTADTVQLSILLDRLFVTTVPFDHHGMPFSIPVGSWLSACCSLCGQIYYIQLCVLVCKAGRKWRVLGLSWACLTFIFQSLLSILVYLDRRTPEFYYSRMVRALACLYCSSKAAQDVLLAVTLAVRILALHRELVPSHGLHCPTPVRRFAKWFVLAFEMSLITALWSLAGMAIRFLAPAYLVECILVFSHGAMMLIAVVSAGANVEWGSI
ncbi:hypothetical protein CBOM_03763 [Ceraceosorus bombacis]|uniref:Uncharacterized protein n=1 Tax=Ceraceosorus bombacis TaxID=401625 RepID=A0A0P1BHG7_9BASI|nr:hypothetical protein CBOM_03763 [Ceraceosorus bombacis]